MVAQFWSITGNDIWRLNNPVCELKNLDTGEVLQLHVSIPEQFKPVTMPTVKSGQENTAVKKQKRGPKIRKPRMSGKSSQYKGVSYIKKTGKWRAQVWDTTEKKNINLGTSFKSELLAAAAIEDYRGNHKKARQMRNEYEEGDCMPENNNSGQGIVRPMED